MSFLTTPSDVEARLLALSDELDSAHHALERAEQAMVEAKMAHMEAHARATVAIDSDGVKRTVDKRKAEVDILTSESAYRLSSAEAVARLARDNVFRVKTQIEIARSLGTSVRSAMELS
jgi:hypothetical protein